jgi:hypothetical protein
MSEQRSAVGNPGHIACSASGKEALRWPLRFLQRGAVMTSRSASSHKRTSSKTTARKAPSRQPSARKASGKAASGKAASGKAMTGKAMTGKAASGKAMTGKAMTGKARTGKAASGKAMTGKAASGKAVAGKAVAGKAVARKATTRKTMADESRHGAARPAASADPASAGKGSRPGTERARDEQRDEPTPRYGGGPWSVADERGDVRFGHARNDDADPSELAPREADNDDDESPGAADPELAAAEAAGEIQSGGEHAGMHRGETPRKNKSREP